MTTRMNALTRRRFLTATGMVGAGVVLSACGGGSQSPGAEPAAGDGGASGYDGPEVDLAFWNGFTGGDGPVMQQLVDQFNGEHPNIAVKMTVMEWADYYQKVPTAVQSGNGPDVGIMHIDSLPTNAARNVIVPLDDVAEALDLKAGDFAEVVWSAGEYDGQRFGIPLDVHPLGFFYNKTVLESAGLDPDNPPTDRTSYEAALETLKSAGIQGHWMSPHVFTGALTAQALVWQFGGDLFNADGTEVTWAEDPAVEALTWAVDLVRNGYSASDVGQDADAIALQNGQTAFNWNGIWNINTLREVPGLQWGVAALPNIGGTQAAWAGSHNFVLPRQRNADENKLRAARVFINWVSQQSLAWAEGGQVPARNSVRESAEFQALTEQAALAEQVDHLRFPPAVPGIGDVLADFNQAVNEAVLLTKEPAAALSEAADRAAKKLEENRDRYDG
ncbi:multiple sugar transport system substrate-binding protein [Jiangella alba]|uniref:Multiple sugar transport system substrate-binding protein n=2 Tax=Jiangella alba TaxID=561176 RepID=A0A1H5I3J7_9ACTN|nr:ABC transporter substrate-binding protein [Jiangella alba]SEE34777.1 multiple sugar transport system substrate-binding protein [Jiangella alba]